MMREPEARLQALAAAFPIDWSQWYRGRDADHAALAVLASLLADARVGREVDRDVESVQRGLLRRYRDLLGSDGDAEVRGFVAAIDAVLAAAETDPEQTRCLIAQAMRVASFESDEIQALHRSALAAEMWESRTHRDAYQACLDSWAAESGPAETPVQHEALVAGIQKTLRARRGLGPADEPLEPVSGGFSKLTLRGRLDGRAIVVRADCDVDFAGMSVGEEFDVMATASAAGIPVPRPIEKFPAEFGLHAGFITVEHVAGTPFGWVPQFRSRSLCRQLGTILADIHAVDHTELTAVRGSNLSTRRQMAADIAHCERSWRAVGCVRPLVEYALQWLRTHAEWGDGRRTLVHGDYRPQNILRVDDTITAVLDWEHAKIGNPAEDLAYLREAVVALWSWEEFLDAYIARGGIAPDERALRYYDVYAGLFVVTILDQVEQRFAGTSGQPIFEIASVLQNRAIKLDRLAELLDLPTHTRSASESASHA